MPAPQDKIDALLRTMDAPVTVWNATAQAPLVLTYQFESAQPADLATSYSGWTPFTEAQKEAVRAALAKIDGGSGTDDVAAYETAASAVSLDLQSGAHSGGDAVGDVLTGIEGLSGSAFNDFLFGDTLVSRLLGGTKWVRL